MIEPLEELIRGVPFFRSLDRLDVARLIGALERAGLPAGTVIFAEEAEADGLFLLESGRVAVSVKGAGGDEVIAELEAPAYFGELGLLLTHRTASVHAMTDVRAWKLPRGRFERLARERATIGLAIGEALADLVDRRTRERVSAPMVARARSAAALDLETAGAARPRRWRIAPLLIVLGVPLALWAGAPPHGLSVQGWRVLLVVIGAALAWLLDVGPDFVVALAMTLAWGAMNLVPPAQIFAGFTSPSYFVAFGALGLAAAFARSGLLFRTALLSLRIFPATYLGQVLGLLAGGCMTTPLMPLSLGRVATIAPLTHELADELGYAEKSRGRAGLSFAGTLGYGAFSSIFFTGLAMNFYVYELLPPADRMRFDWLTWLASAAVTGVLIFAGAVLLLALFRPEQEARATAEVLQRQGRVLGPLSGPEKITIAALAVFLLGLVLQPFVHVGSTWLALSALVLVTGGVLGREGFRSSIDWGFLILFGVLLGSGAVLRSVGVDRWIADALVPFTQGIHDRGMLILGLGVFVVACRLVLPWIPATLLLSLALVPAAPRLGVSPWIVGFVILVVANAWIHPRQSDYCRLTREATRGEMFTERHGLIVGIGLTSVTLIGIAASIPYWRALGLLGR